jgi:hypothetical protein
VAALVTGSGGSAAGSNPLAGCPSERAPERAFWSVVDVEPADVTLIEVLRERDGVPTTVLLRDGQRLRVLNIAWGYDDGEEWAHVTTNVSPSSDSDDVDFFSTDTVVTVLDPADQAVLWCVST